MTGAYVLQCDVCGEEIYDERIRINESLSFVPQCKSSGSVDPRVCESCIRHALMMRWWKRCCEDIRPFKKHEAMSPR
jgi:hypothetical protein